MKFCLLTTAALVVTLTHAQDYHNYISGAESETEVRMSIFEFYSTCNIMHHT